MKLILNQRDKIEKKVAKLISQRINNSKTNPVTLAIPGGSSVSGIFKQLLKEKVDWNKTRIFMVDERLVNLTHKDSNYKQAYQTFLKTLIDTGAIQPSNIFPFQFNPDVSDLGVKQYGHQLKEIKDHFDICLLSAGEDGHVAGLFPEHETIKDKNEYFITSSTSPKPPKDRMSSSLQLLLRSKLGILLFLGESKQQAFQTFQKQELPVKQFPARLIRFLPESYVLTDLDIKQKL